MFPGAGGGLAFDVPGYSDDRMGLARYSMEQMLLSNDQIQNVQIIRFGSGADGGVWMTKAQALTFIQNNANWTDGGSTNYEAALAAGDRRASAPARPLPGPTRPSSTSCRTERPTAGNSIDPGGVTPGGDGVVTITDWENHVTSQGIDQVFAIGIGGGVSVANLEPIAYPNTDTQAPIGDEDNVILVSTANVNALLDTLQDLLGGASSITGNILLDDPTASRRDPSAPTAGGFCPSRSTASPTPTIRSPSTSPRAPGRSRPRTRRSLTVTTALGGSFTFYFAASGPNAAGSWSYLTDDAGHREHHLCAA